MSSAIALALLWSAPVHADGTAAARAFNEGQTAQLEGDFERAAQAFELAYTIAPSKEALRSAVRARQESGQLARAATLAQLLRDQYGSDLRSVTLAEEVLALAAGKLGRLRVACPARCSVAIAGRALSLGESARHDLYVNPGAYSFQIAFGSDRSVHRDLTIRAGGDTELAIDAPPVVAHAPPARAAAAPAAPPRAPRRGIRRLSPVVPAVGAVVTLGLAGAAIWSGVDTNRAHDAYVADPTDARWDDGLSKQRRTNILFGATAGVGVATAVVAVLFTRWTGGERRAVAAITAEPGGFGMAVAGRF